MISFLYVILGFSLGFGVAIITLQERFIRERRRLIALNQAERVKNSESQSEDLQRIKAEKTACQEALEECRRAAAEAARPEAPEREDSTQAATAPEEMEPRIDPQARERVEQLENELASARERLMAEEATRKILQDTKEHLEEDVVNLEGETHALKEEILRQKETITGLKGLIEDLESQLSVQKQKVLEDSIVVSPGNHILPGRVARALMRENASRR